MGFAAGLRTGAGLVQQVLENERQEKLDARETEKYERQKKMQGEQDTAIQDIRDASTPKAQVALTPQLTQQLKDTYGMTDAQITAAQAGPGGLKAKLASYDVPDSSDLQGPAPAMGLQPPAPAGIAPPAPAGIAPPAPDGIAPVTPAAGLATPEDGGPAPAAAPAKRFTAADVPESGPAKVDDIARERAVGNYALASRDMNAYQASNERLKGLQQREFVNQATAMSDKDAYDYMKQNVNTSGGMPLIVSKEGKGGYRVTSYDSNGEPKDTLLTAPQIKQLVAADKMMKSGYGPEGLAMAGAVHKDLADLVTHYNTGTTQMQTANNQAQNYADTHEETSRHNRATEANAAANTSIARERLGIEKDKMKSENDIIIGADDKTGVMHFDKKSGQQWMTPWADDATQEMKDSVKAATKTTVKPEVHPDGSVSWGENLYTPNPNYGKPNKGGLFSGKDLTMNTTDQYIKVTRPDKAGATTTGAALDALKKDGGGATAAPTAAPAKAAPAPVAPPRQLTQNEQVAASAKVRQDAYDEEQRRQAGRDAVRRANLGLQLPSGTGD
jgi:hypothetical protein